MIIFLSLSFFSLKVLRSAASWSVGVKATECSIHTAWVAAIHGAQHYIYVENQFFISGSENRLKNFISDAIVARIMRAHQDEKEAKERGRPVNKFRVYVVIPLLPSFRGEYWCKFAICSAIVKST